MYNSTYMLDDRSDDEIPTQRAIEESLQDRQKMETSSSATEDGRWEVIPSISSIFLALL